MNKLQLPQAKLLYAVSEIYRKRRIDETEKRILKGTPFSMQKRSSLTMSKYTSCLNKIRRKQISSTNSLRLSVRLKNPMSHSLKIRKFWQAWNRKRPLHLGVNSCAGRKIRTRTSTNTRLMLSRSCLTPKRPNDLISIVTHT